MLIGHIALYTDDLDAMRDFYVKYFGALSDDLYENSSSGFQSYFLNFDDGARLEIMKRPQVDNRVEGQNLGYAHMAMSTGSTGAVDALTEQIRADGHTVKDGPRWTGDGYYESVVLDPDQNEIEITV